MLVIVSNYLLVIADQSEVESATSQRDTAKALFNDIRPEDRTREVGRRLRFFEVGNPFVSDPKALSGMQN